MRDGMNGDSNAIEDPIVKIERCKVDAKIKSEAFARESFKEYSNSLRQQNINSLEGGNFRFIEMLVENDRKKSYDRFYLECLK